jgi:hypothetical protein
VFSLGLAASLVMCARAKPFWHDEVYTILGAQLPPPTLWAASLDGFDLSPPLNTIATRYVHALLGVGPIATRLVPMLGVWVACLVAFAMTRSRTNALFGVAAALLLACTGLFAYGYEARGYGLASGLFAVALYGWSEASRGRRRGVNLALMTAALSAGLWTHYYAVLAFLPIGVGELGRQIFRRRFESLPWLLMLAAGVSAAPLRALAAAGARQAPTFWTATGSDTLGSTYQVVLGELASPIVAATVFVLLAFALASGLMRRGRSPGAVPAIPRWEIAAGLGCLAIPAAGLAIGSLTGVFVPRYALLGAVGIAIVIPTAIGHLAAHSRIAQLATALAALIAAGHAAAGALEPGRFVPWNPFAERQLLADHLRIQPGVVVTGGVLYLQLWYYAPPELRSKMRYLIDPAGALQVTGTDSVDRGYAALARWAPIPAVEAEAFLAAHREFMLYDAGGFWTLPRLKAKGASFQVVGREPRGNLVRVRSGGVRSPAERH